MDKIVRTKTRAEGGITKEEEIKMQSIVKKWTDIAFRTESIDSELIDDAIKRLYSAANLKEPRVVIVPSPMVMAFAYGASAWIWHCMKTEQATEQATAQATAQATRQATLQATLQATRQATEQATLQATEQATLQATLQATEQATLQATLQATDQATWQATDQATLQATDQATWQATDQATAQATWHATDQATEQATDQATWQATEQATWHATDQATWQATDQATWHATAQATDQATEQATLQATAQATRQATDQATAQATWHATDQATWQATDQATRQATDQATAQATWHATDQATWQATDQATLQATAQATRQATFENGAALACFQLSGINGINCANKWHGPYQGGNMWVGFPSFIEAMRDVIGLDLKEFEKWKPWEDCAKHGGFRVMHEEFCIVSDFPKYIKVDSENRPHCIDGPSHEWRDGWKIYHVHGVPISPWIIESTELITVEKIEKENNSEVRRVMMERYGYERYIVDCGAMVVDEVPDDYEVVGIRTAKLLVKEIEDDEPIVYVDVLNSTPEPDGTVRRYMMRVDPEAYDGDARRYAHAAVASTWRLSDDPTSPHYGKLAIKNWRDYRPGFES